MPDQYSIPDFSGDDFANDKEVLKIRAAKQAYQDMFQAAVAHMQKEFDLQEASHINLKGFHMFKPLAAILNHSLKSTVQQKEFRVAIAEYSTHISAGKYADSGTEEYLFGHIRLHKTYPRTYIHRESVKEKLEDLFLKRDLDFPNSKKFSRKFQVLTAEKSYLQTQLQFKNLDALTAFPDMELELDDHVALFRSSRKSISVEETIVFCDLAKLLLQILD